MTSSSYDFIFPEFTLDPAWCDVDVQYTYEVNNRQGHAMVRNWDEQNRTFSFQYTKNFLPFSDDILLESVDFFFKIIANAKISENSEIEESASFTLQVLNPCLEAAQLPLVDQPIWCQSSPEEDMTDWIKDIDNISLYGDQKSTYMLYHLG